MRTDIERILHPKAVDDYAVCVTLTEEQALAIPELKPWVEDIIVRRAAEEAMAKLMRRFGENCSKAFAALLEQEAKA